jgi:SMI1 / KNR4 family (SUKH-1)
MSYHLKASQNTMNSIKECAARFSKLFDAVENTAPTELSIRIISEKLGFVLPSDYVEFAKLTPGYSRWFASIGEDFEDPYHILAENAWYHTAENILLPPELIVINHGFDGDLICYDLSRRNDQNQISICYCEGLEGESKITPGSKKHLAFSISEYLIQNIESWERSRTDAKNDRRAQPTSVDNVVSAAPEK